MGRLRYSTGIKTPDKQSASRDSIDIRLHIDSFIYLDIDEDTIVDRLSKRRVCKTCGDNYHLENLPPKEEGVCDKCGSELVQRKDDNPEVIKKRWEVLGLLVNWQLTVRMSNF